MSAVALHLARVSARRRRRGPLERHCWHMFCMWSVIGLASVAFTPSFPLTLLFWLFAIICGSQAGWWLRRWDDARRQGL